jgi:hypothetical protein
MFHHVPSLFLLPHGLSHHWRPLQHLGLPHLAHYHDFALVAGDVDNRGDVGKDETFAEGGAVAAGGGVANGLKQKSYFAFFVTTLIPRNNKTK